MLYWHTNASFAAAFLILTISTLEIIKTALHDLDRISQYDRIAIINDDPSKKGE